MLNMRLFSDAQYPFSPDGAMDEARLWNVRRTTEQIRANLNVRVDSAQPGLVAVWPLDAHPADIIGPHDGSGMGPGIHALNAPVASDCGAQTATHLCLEDRFSVSARFRTAPAGGAESQAMTLPCPGPGLCDNSGIFWFFQNTNWEIMMKALNGCGLNNRWWVFSAATTNVFYRLEVTDVTSGETKIYFNYQGPPAPAVTDTSALDVCP
jgi:hypothetical protein